MPVSEILGYATMVVMVLAPFAIILFFIYRGRDLSVTARIVLGLLLIMAMEWALYHLLLTLVFWDADMMI